MRRNASEGREWSGKRDSNPRLRPWQGRTLPLSYSRSPKTSKQSTTQIMSHQAAPSSRTQLADNGHKEPSLPRAHRNAKIVAVNTRPTNGQNTPSQLTVLHSNSGRLSRSTFPAGTRRAIFQYDPARRKVGSNLVSRRKISTLSSILSFSDQPLNFINRYR